MSDLEARRLARDLLRSGLSGEQALDAILSELGSVSVLKMTDGPTWLVRLGAEASSPISAYDRFRSVAFMLPGADMRHEVQEDPGLGYVSSFPNDVITHVAAPKRVHRMTVTWTEPLPFAPLPAATPTASVPASRPPEDEGDHDFGYDDFGRDEDLERE